MKIPDGLQVGRFRYEPNAIPLVNRPARIDIEPTSRGPQRLESKRGAHDSFMDERRLKLVRHSGRTSRDEPYGGGGGQLSHPQTSISTLSRSAGRARG